MTFAAAAWLWAVVLPAAAWTAERPGAPGPLRFGTALVYVAGGVLCHQRPERSMRVRGTPLPVCARCAGIYWGAAAMVLTLALARPFTHGAVARPDRGRRDLWRWTIAALVLNAGTLIFEWGGGAPGNDVRALAGLALGSVAAWIVWHATRPGWQSG